jgi:hypothetical protein
MLLRTIYQKNQMNRIVNFKGNRAKRHACGSSNICRMPHPITDCSLASDQNKLCDHVVHRQNITGLLVGAGYYSSEDKILFTCQIL